jgi:hypothetical protein
MIFSSVTSEKIRFIRGSSHRQSRIRAVSRRFDGFNGAKPFALIRLIGGAFGFRPSREQKFPEKMKKMLTRFRHVR